MLSLAPLRRLAGANLTRIPLLPVLLLLPALLPAQDIPVVTNGRCSITAVPPVYNQRYVIQRSDFGFFTLDTLTNTPGHVQATSSCGQGLPPSDSNLYVVADCNGVGRVSSSGNTVLVRLESGQCGAQTRGCGGPRDDGHFFFSFALGTWQYLGDGTEIPDSTQTTDPQGRTWTLTIDPANPFDGRHFIWHGSGNPTAPPNANASATNLSIAARAAAGRPDSTNYFGDIWSLRDTSSSIAPITGVQWNFNYVSPTFVVDRAGSAGDTINPAYFPCAPSAGGNIATGVGCFTSVGGVAGNYVFSLKATNQYGTTQYTPSPAISVAIPQVRILGFSGGTLSVLTGGNADASGTQGNPTAFNWTFTPGGPLTGAVVQVPAGATSFTLQVTYAGYTPPLVSGSINQVDLVPAFSLSPSTVLINGNLTLTNQMQKAVGATLRSVDYTINTTPPPYSGSFTSQIVCPGPSFCNAGGTATVQAPPTVSNYYVHLRYTFTPTAGPPDQTSSTVSNLFTTTNWAPNPQILMTPAPFCSPSCQLTTGTQYSLSDNETILVTPHPGALWELVSSAGPATIGQTTDANNAISWTPSAVCANCTLRVTVSGVTASVPVTISNPVGPPPTGPSVTISGPTSLNINQTGTFSANVTNATAPVSYSWFVDLQPAGSSSSMSTSWSSSGSHSVAVNVTAANGTASATVAVSVVGNPAPLGTFTLTPSQKSGTTYTVGRGVELTFTADEQYANQIGWVFGDSTSAGGPPAAFRTFKKTYGTNGTYTGQLLVWGDGSRTTGFTASVFTVVVTLPDPSTAFTVQNATVNPLADYDAYAGAILTFTASEPAANFVWDFGDGTAPVASRTATHVYTSLGPFNAKLSAFGDGVNTNIGPANRNFKVNVSRAPWQGVVIPGAAKLGDSTTTWGTDVSISNAGPDPMTINLAYVPFLSPDLAPLTQDMTQLTYGPDINLAPGGSKSFTDVVGALNGNGKGTVVIKYSGTSKAPLVSARVYFQPTTNPGNISYASGIPVYNMDGAGQITPQSYTPVASYTGTTDGLQLAGQEALEGTITVNKTGTGSGRVTSNPAGIDCGTTCSASLAAPVTLTGAADPGSVFVGFTAGCDSQLYGQCIITSASATVTAKFDATAPPGNSTLTVTKTGTGSGTVTSNPAGINCGTTCSGQFSQSTTVTLTASAATGSTFSGWGGACSGTGSCSVSMATNQSVSATFTSSDGPPPPPPTFSDQYLIGLRSDPRYRFGVALVNASTVAGSFRTTALDEQGSPLLICCDGSGGLVAYRDFTIRPFQQVYLTNDDLGLNDPNKRYVLKATKTSSTGTLVASGSALDRVTRALDQIVDDGQASAAEAGLVSYWVAGVSRYDSSYGARWRTDLRIYNRGSRARNLYFEYSFYRGGDTSFTERVAKVNQVPIAAGQLLTYDDVITSLLARDTTADVSGSTAGVLRIYYPEDSESQTRPLIISSRNYDDQPTGTSGTRLALYTRAHAAGPNQKLYLAGAEESARYRTLIGFFTMDAGPVSFRVVALDPDGNEVGSLATALGGSGLHYGQLDMTRADFNFRNPGKPVTIRVDEISGGRLTAYAIVVDKVTFNPNFIQALPK